MTLTGLFVPLITPFDESGAVALDALETLAHEILDAGATGLVALGTTAEPSALSPGERRDVLDVLSAVCRQRRAPLIAGANDADQLRALAGRPAVVAALSLVPPFLRPGEEGVLAHFAALAAASPVPLVAYHVPYRTAQPLSPAALRRLAGIEAMAGIKLATGAVDAGVTELMACVPSGFAVLGGDDAVIAPLLALGAAGGILASAHLETRAFADLIDAWHRGDTTRARPLGHRLARLSAAVFAEPNPTVLKGVLHAQRRIPTAAVRLPLLPAGRAAVETTVGLLGGTTGSSAARYSTSGYTSTS
jgi:4-hydroxy-tetrahydrodipicolinate synthase